MEIKATENLSAEKNLQPLASRQKVNELYNREHYGSGKLMAELKLAPEFICKK